MKFDNSTFETTDEVASSSLAGEGSSFRNVHSTDEVVKNKSLFGFGK
jgi:hypothetical protein